MEEVAEYIRQHYEGEVDLHMFAGVALGSNGAFRHRYPAAKPQGCSWQVYLGGVPYDEWAKRSYPPLPTNVLPDRVYNEEGHWKWAEQPCSIQVRRRLQVRNVPYEININDTGWIPVDYGWVGKLRISLAEESFATPVAEEPVLAAVAAAAPAVPAAPVVPEAAINSSSSSDDDESDLLPPHTHAGGGLMF